MALHEIGYLVIGGVFQCFFWGEGNSCPNAESIKVSGISYQNIADFEYKQLIEDTSGFVVYSIEKDRIEIRKKSGEKFFVNLSELNKVTRKALPKKTPQDQAHESEWRFESLENLFKQTSIGGLNDFLSQLRSNDLKTPVHVPQDKIEKIRSERMQAYLKEKNLALPIAYLLTKRPCTYEKVSATVMTPTCPFPIQVTAYETPNLQAQKIQNVALTSDRLLGMLRKNSRPHPSEIEEEILIFEDKGDWLKLQSAYTDEQSRFLWVQKKDLPFSIFTLKNLDRPKLLLASISPSVHAAANRGPSDQQEISNRLKSLIEEPVSLSLRTANETKWFEGILWVKVHVDSAPPETMDEGQILMTGWLPYIDPKTKKNVLIRYPFGC